MSNEPDESDFVASGDWGEVRYCQRANGKYEAKSWIEGSASDSEKSKFDHLFRRIASTGHIYNIEQFRMLGDGIFEFKRDGNRVLCFLDGRCWLLTHHFHKGGKKKCPPPQIAHAIIIRTEYFEGKNSRAKNANK